MHNRPSMLWLQAVEHNLAEPFPVGVYDRPTRPGLHGRSPFYVLLAVLVLCGIAAAAVAARALLG